MAVLLPRGAAEVASGDAVVWGWLWEAASAGAAGTAHGYAEGVESRAASEHPRVARSRGGISPQTLIIASVASAVASFAASRLWGAGTLISAAATPVIVALVSEVLRRPMQTVAATAKKVPLVQPVPAAQRPIADAEHPDPLSWDPAVGGERQPRSAPARQPRSAKPDAVTPEGEVSTITYYGSRRPRWRVAVVTGLIAFGIVVAFYTVTEVLAGRSITGNGQPTTFFGGSANAKKKTSPITTVTTSTTTPATSTTPTTTTTTTPTTTTPTTSSTTPTSTLTTTPTTNTTPSAANSTTPRTTTGP